MVSINLSDFFHAMLIAQAFRPVSRCGEQSFPTGGFGPGEEPIQDRAEREAMTGRIVGVLGAVCLCERDH